MRACKSVRAQSLSMSMVKSFSSTTLVRADIRRCICNTDPKIPVDVINATIQSLTTLSRTNKRPAFGSIFLLNNMSYLRTRLIVEPRTDIPSLLSKPSKDLLNSNFRTAKAGYFDSNFSPLMQTLQEDKDKSRSATKEKFTRFFDLLEEVAERHRMARVLSDDKDGRETVSEEVVKLVVPSLQRFTQRNIGKEFSKSKYYCGSTFHCSSDFARSSEVYQDVRRRSRISHSQFLLVGIGHGSQTSTSH